MDCHNASCAHTWRCPAVGLFIGILQAATQIQEMTLSFIPKLAAVAAVLFLVGPWMLTILLDFTTPAVLRNSKAVGVNYADNAR